MTGHLRAARRVGFWLLAGAVVLSGLAMIYTVIEKPGPGALYDFRGGLYNAGVAILHGHSPYRPALPGPPGGDHARRRIAIGETAARPFSIPVYPAAREPRGGAAEPAAVLAGGRGLHARLDRRDARRDCACWACATGAAWFWCMISWPFMFGLYLGAVGPFLVLGAGVAWRYRDRLWPPALAVGIAGRRQGVPVAAGGLAADHPALPGVCADGGARGRADARRLGGDRL